MDYNVALCPEDCGWIVADLDGGPIGEESWAKLQEANGAAPDTFEVTTPRGGRHLYYAGSGRSTVQKIGEKVDTRGVGGYVLIPPSVVNGQPYRVTQRRSIADAPEWLPRLAAARTEALKVVDGVLDLPNNVARAVAFLNAQPEVSQGNGADSRTYQIACALQDLGLSPEKSLEIMLEHYKLSPRDERFEAFLERKIASASSYRQNEGGVWANQPAGEVFGDALAKAGVLHAPDPAARKKYHIYRVDEQDQWEDPQWLIPDYLPAAGIAMIYGQPGTWKSFTALDLALTLASGIPGWNRPASDPLQVLYVAGEQPTAMGKSRRPAWQIARDVTNAQLATFGILKHMPKAYDATTILELIASIEEDHVKPAVIIIDTLARFMGGLDENSAKDMGNAIECLDVLVKAFNCLVLVLHHSGKNGATGARGSSALEGGFDTMIEAVRTKGAPALALWVRKQKDAAEASHPMTFEVKALAKSAVLFPTTPERHGQLTRSSDVIAQARVASALGKLGARDLEHSVTTYVLAAELLPVSDVETAEQRQEGVDRIAKLLDGQARKSLSGYVDRINGRNVWGLLAA